MRNGTYYLNNSGTRWVHLTNGKKDQLYVLCNGEYFLRTCLYWSAFGNFAVVTFSWKGKKVTTFVDDQYNDLPVVNYY